MAGARRRQFSSAVRNEAFTEGSKSLIVDPGGY
jgi:hypothetical protein